LTFNRLSTSSPAEYRLDIIGYLKGAKIQQGPDEALYVLTDGNEGKILRLAPKKR
jgi:hypothetical protein